MSGQFVTATNYFAAAITGWATNGTPISMSAWCYADSTPAVMGILKLDATATGDGQTLQTIGGALGNIIAMSIDQSVSSNAAQAPGSFSTGSFFHTGLVMYSAAERTAFLQGAKTHQVTGVFPTGFDRMLISFSTIGTAWDGRLASLAVWDASLTDEEMISMSKGFSPRRVRPQSLRMYIPLIRGVNELRVNAVLTGPTPTVFHPHPRQYGL